NDGGNGSGGGSGSGNLASDAVAAALAYRAQAPVLDGLMKELGLDGSSLSGLVKGAAEAEADKPAPSPAKPTKPAKLAKPRDNDGDDSPTGEAAE
ncbi:MAG: flotillin, partial [Erythrobacter sp.]|nr:flotillin [Erythrobacter sp.]